MCWHFLKVICIITILHDCIFRTQNTSHFPIELKIGQYKIYRFDLKCDIKNMLGCVGDIVKHNPLVNTNQMVLPYQCNKDYNLYIFYIIILIIIK